MSGYYTREEIRSIAREEIRDEKWRDFWISQIFGGKKPLTEEKVEEITKSVVNRHLKSNNYTTFSDVERQLQQSNFTTKREVTTEINSRLADLKLSLQEVVTKETTKCLSRESGVQQLLNDHQEQVNQKLQSHNSDVEKMLQSHDSKVKSVHNINMNRITESHDKHLQNYTNKLSILEEKIVNEISDTSSKSPIFLELEKRNQSYLDNKIKEIRNETIKEINSLQNTAICTSVIVGLLSGLAGLAIGSYRFHQK